MTSTSLHQRSSGLRRVLETRHHDPFEVLGRHAEADGVVVRALLPYAQSAAVNGELTMQRVSATDLFEWRGEPDKVRAPYRLCWKDADGHAHDHYDPYCFAPQLSDFDLHLFGEGSHRHAYCFLGANPHTVDDVTGVLFATWAPNAARVSVVGDFNAWDGRCHPMRSRDKSGVWELFVPGLGAGTVYKFEIRARAGEQVFLKSDPYAKAFEQRPKTASVVCSEADYQWTDQRWMAERTEQRWLAEPVSVYEVHLGSWRREAASFPSYRELAATLVPYVKALGFTHIELLPITEHPLDASWGYQAIGYFAPTSRFGEPDDLRYFIECCHAQDIGVLLDWVPAHFPKDAFALARFDGSALYEHEDPRLGEHREWGTLIFNYGRCEVKSFLISSVMYWLQAFYIDGLRVDAVASMLYLDYSREDGDWLPNQHGGNENLEAMAFLRELNEATHAACPGSVTVAEESTSWPQVTRPTWVGGLGFSMKWNMGWMHDTLEYFANDPVHRSFHHNQLTFGLLYAFTENFVLPFSHDEVVHGKGSLLSKMPGDDWQQFANLRLLYTYLWTYPGKKLLFMGCEFAQRDEWSHERSLTWPAPDWHFHHGVSALVSDLNALYRGQPALHAGDFDATGFSWLDCNDSAHSVLSYVRHGGGSHAVVVLNFTPVPRAGYRIGIPQAGRYREALNSDSEHYAGSNIGNLGVIESEPHPVMDCEQSLVINLPPLGALVLLPQHDEPRVTSAIAPQE